MNETLQVIKSRRCVRTYLSEQIKEEELQAIIEAGLYAPSAHNEQPWHFTVIQNKELIDEISAVSKKMMTQSETPWIAKMGANEKLHISYNAPTLIIVSGRKGAISPEVDSSAAIQNMLLAAESLNIGSVWLGLVRYFLSIEENVKKLGLPEGYEPYFGVAFGYKAVERELKAPKRADNTVNYIR